MPVPIEKIAEEKLHLTVHQGHHITSDFSILEEICFSTAPSNYKIPSNVVKKKSL